MKCLIQSILFIFLLLIPFSTCIAWQGKVTGVADGDTITVMHNDKQEKKIILLNNRQKDEREKSKNT